MINGGKPKGGQLSRRAAYLCQDYDFGLFLDQYQSRKQGVKIPYGTHNEQDRADAIRKACNISSRAELDHSYRAKVMFWRIEREFRKWQLQRASKNERTCH